MKKILAAFAVFAIALVVLTQPALAGGDQVTGENGQGDVTQNGPCPFGDGTPAGPSN